MRKLTKSQMCPEVKHKTPYGEITVAAALNRVIVSGSRMYVNRMDLSVHTQIDLDEDGLVPTWEDGRLDGSVNKTNGRDYNDTYNVSNVSRQKVLGAIYATTAAYVKANPRFAAEGAARGQLRWPLFVP